LNLKCKNKPKTYMKKGTKVSWFAEGATVRGTGVTISDEDEYGTVLVAVYKGVFQDIPIAYHMVIHCTVTWLSVVTQTPTSEPFPLPIVTFSPESINAAAVAQAGDEIATEIIKRVESGENLG
jgi:hypothetical protein